MQEEPFYVHINSISPGSSPGRTLLNGSPKQIEHASQIADKVLVKITPELPADVKFNEFGSSPSLRCGVRRNSGSENYIPWKPSGSLVGNCNGSRGLSRSGIRIPCRVEETKHENGRVEPIYNLQFHKDSIDLAQINPLFSAQMHQAGRDALREHFKLKSESLDWSQRTEPPNGIVSQTTKNVVIIWKFTDQQFQQQQHAAIDLKVETYTWNSSSYAKLSLLKTSPIHSAPTQMAQIICQAETGKSFTGGVAKFGRNTFSWKIQKADADSVRVWRSIKLGKDQSKLSLVTFPETRIFQMQAALHRSKDAGNRSKYGSKSSKKPQENRPLTLLSHSSTEALVDISNQDAEPLEVPLSVVTTGEGLEEGSSLSNSSPESYDMYGAGTTSSAKESQESEPDFPPPSKLRPRSMSECGLPPKGILKKSRDREMFRSVSENPKEPLSAVLDSCLSLASESSLDGPFSGSDNESESLSSSQKKSVRFSEKILRHSFKSSSSILGQKKKNMRREKNRKRRNSEGESSQGSESEEHTGLATTPEDGDLPNGLRSPKFPIETIPEDKLLETNNNQPSFEFPESKGENSPRTSFSEQGEDMDDTAIFRLDEDCIQTIDETATQPQPKDNKENSGAGSKKKSKGKSKNKSSKNVDKILKDSRYSGFVMTKPQTDKSKSDSSDQDSSGPDKISKTASEDSAIGDTEELTEDDASSNHSKDPRPTNLRANPRGTTRIDADHEHADDEWEAESHSYGKENGEQRESGAEESGGQEWEEVIGRKRKVWRKKRAEFREGTGGKSGGSGEWWSQGTTDSGIDQMDGTSYTLSPP